MDPFDQFPAELGHKIVLLNEAITRCSEDVERVNAEFRANPKVRLSPELRRLFDRSVALTTLLYEMHVAIEKGDFEYAEALADSDPSNKAEGAAPRDDRANDLASLNDDLFDLESCLANFQGGGTSEGQRKPIGENQRIALERRWLWTNGALPLSTTRGNSPTTYATPSKTRTAKDSSASKITPRYSFLPIHSMGVELAQMAAHDCLSLAELKEAQAKLGRTETHAPTEMSAPILDTPTTMEARAPSAPRLKPRKAPKPSKKQAKSRGSLPRSLARLAARNSRPPP